jgi:chromosome segregation ATPase
MLEAQVSDLREKVQALEKEKALAIRDASAQKALRQQLEQELEEAGGLSSLKEKAARTNQEAEWAARAMAQLSVVNDELQTVSGFNVQLTSAICVLNDSNTVAMSQLATLKEQLASVTAEKSALNIKVRQWQHQFDETLQELWAGKWKAEPATAFLEAEKAELQRFLQQREAELDECYMWEATRQPSYLEKECNALRTSLGNERQWWGAKQQSWEAERQWWVAEWNSLRCSYCGKSVNQQKRLGAGQQQEDRPPGFFQKGHSRRQR